MSEGITANQLADDIVTVLKKTVTLTDAQIKALPTTPVQIVGAPGAGKVIIPIKGLLSIDSEAGAYANVANQDVGGVTAIYFYTGSRVSFGTPDIAGNSAALSGASIARLLEPTGLHTYQAGDIEITMGAANAGEPKSDIAFDGADNQALIMSLDNYTSDYLTNLGNFTGGHANNTLKVTVLYTIIDV